MQTPLDYDAKKALLRILKHHGYENVLAQIAVEADDLGVVSGSELAGRLEGLIGNFGYFPVCSQKKGDAPGHDISGTCPECGQTEK